VSVPTGTYTHTHTQKHARKFNIILFLRNERGMSKIQSKTRVLQADAALVEWVTYGGEKMPDVPELLL
jgi:hypothetical protein